MIQKRYEIRRGMAEIRVKHRDTRPETGCTIGKDEEPEILEFFATKEEALKALKMRKSTAAFRDWVAKFWDVKEYYVEENDYEVDEYGELEWVSGGDIWEILPIEWDD